MVNISSLTIDDKTMNISGKMDKTDPTATGSFSLNRKSGTSIGTKSVAEGNQTTASGEASHAEGNSTTASGEASHAEGKNTTASGNYGSHAEGYYTIASGNDSHTEGDNTKAKGNNSHAEGYYTIAHSANQHVQGKYNIEDTEGTYADIVGNGTGDSNRSNAYTLDWNGNGVYSGTVSVNNNKLLAKVDDIGRNLWDEVWELGAISTSTGENVDSTTCIRSTHYIDVNPLETLYFNCPTGYDGFILFYKQNKQLISYSDSAFTNHNLTIVPNAYYIRFYLVNLTTYSNNICINIPDMQNGTYTPFNKLRKNIYETSNEALDIKMLGWSVPKECPIQNYIDANRKFHQRVGRVDLGSLSWTYNSSYEVFHVPLIAAKMSSDSGFNVNGFCVKYKLIHETSLSDLTDKTLVFGKNVFFIDDIVIKDSSYTNVSTFQQAMSGIYFYYELATEIVISVDGNEVTNKKIIYPSLCKNTITLSGDTETYVAPADGWFTIRVRVSTEGTPARARARLNTSQVYFSACPPATYLADYINIPMCRGDGITIEKTNVVTDECYFIY